MHMYKAWQSGNPSHSGHPQAGSVDGEAMGAILPLASPLASVVGLRFRCVEKKNVCLATLRFRFHTCSDGNDCSPQDPCSLLPVPGKRNHLSANRDC